MEMHVSLTATGDENFLSAVRDERPAELVLMQHELSETRSQYAAKITDDADYTTVNTYLASHFN